MPPIQILLNSKKSQNMSHIMGYLKGIFSCRKIEIKLNC